MIFNPNDSKEMTVDNSSNFGKYDWPVFKLLSLIYAPHCKKSFSPATSDDKWKYDKDVSSVRVASYIN